MAQVRPGSTLGTYADENGADQFYAFAYKVDVKSLVWYSPEGFEDNGYEIPGTMEELVALSDQMVADGLTPLVYRHRVRWRYGLDRDRLDGRRDAAHHFS